MCEPYGDALKTKEKPSKFKTVIHHTEPLWRCEEQLVFPDHYLGYGWQ